MITHEINDQVTKHGAAYRRNRMIKMPIMLTQKIRSFSKLFLQIVNKRQ